MNDISRAVDIANRLWWWIETGEWVRRGGGK